MCLPLVSPTRNAALVGTPINVLGGGEGKRARQEVLALKVNSEIKCDKITFVTEKVWNNPDSGKQNKRVNILFKEGGLEESEIVMVMQATIPFESNCLRFSKDITVDGQTSALNVRLRNGTDAIERLAVNLGAEEPETTSKEMKQDRTYFFDERTKSCEIGLDLQDRVCDSKTISDYLVQLRRDCVENTCKLIRIRVLDIFLVNLNFGLLCEQIHNHF